MKRSIVYFIIIVTLINLTALVTMICQRRIEVKRIAQTGARGSRFEKVTQELALTAAQINHFESIRTEFHSRIDSLNLIMEGLRGQLLREIWQPQPAALRIDSLLYQISHLQMESQHLVVRHFNQFKEVLTPAQWQKFYEFVSKNFQNPGKYGCSGRSTRTEKDDQ
jgi:Spy/CpxP family protein refolding chaperone